MGREGVQPSAAPRIWFLSKESSSVLAIHILYAYFEKNNIWEKKLILSIVTKMSIKLFLYVSVEYTLTHMTKFHINIDRICSSHMRMKNKKVGWDCLVSRPPGC